VRKQIYTGKLKAEIESNARAKGGKQYLIPVTSLPTEAQEAFWREKQKEISTERTTQATALPSPPSEKIRTIAELVAKYGEQKAKEILKKPRQREKVVLEALESTEAEKEKTRRMEALAKKHKISFGTLRRWVSAYLKDGLIGLVHDKYLEPGEGLAMKDRRTVNEEMRNFILAMYLRDMKPKGSHVLKELKKAAEIKGWKLPSKATIYRVIEEVSKSEVVMARKGKQAWKAEIRPKTKRNYNNLMVMQEIVGDGHPFDLFVEYEGRAIRPDLSAWVDLRSRKLVGWCITPQANSESIGLALKHAIETHGLPGTIYTDNGKDYLSTYIEAVCHDLDIGIRNCIPKSPQSKLIERLFREVHDKFTRYQPGYCGNKPENRPEGFNQNKLLKAGKLITLEELARRFGAWMEEYNNTVHGALKDTPANVFNNVEHFRPGTVDPRVLDVLFMKRENVLVHDGYIRLYGRDFWTFGTDLDWLIGKYVEVWYDYNNMGQVLVKYNGRIVGTAVNKKALDHGESRADLVAEQRAKAKFEKETKRRIDAYAQGIPDELDGILPEDVLKRKRGRRYVTGPKEAQAQSNVRRITGYERDAVTAAEALEADVKPRPEKVSRVKKMLMEAGRQALGY
jgi:putative transposase